MSSSGAPKKIEGIKSRNVCVIAKDVMKIASVIGWNGRRARDEIIIVATRLIWMPGNRPVIVPTSIPASSVRM